MRKNIFSIMSASLLLTLGACSSEQDITVAEEEVATTTEETTTTSISFSFGTTSTRAASRVTTSEDSTVEGEIQTEEETAVTRLIAVFFTDADGSGTAGAETTDFTGDEVFYKYTYVVGEYGDSYDSSLDESAEYTIDIVGSGHYQLCFVANPSETLELEIGALESGTSTLTEFKALTENQDPATKSNPGMAMTSTCFYEVVSGETNSLGTVHLQRIMSRIDIINLADGLTISKAVLYNRTITSYLFNDDKSDNSDYYEETSKEYSFSTALAGNSEDTNGTSEDELSSSSYSIVNASKAEIYSYEQYADDEDDVPYLEIYYTIDGSSQSYMHTVKFLETVESDDGTTSTEPIYFNRNYCYRVLLDFTANNEIAATIHVTDWEKGTSLTVSQTDIESSLGVSSDTEEEDDDSGSSSSNSVDTSQYATSSVEVGDFVMSDGIVVSSSTMETYVNETYNSEDETTFGENAIAMVFYVGTDRIGDGATEALSTAGVSTPTGLAISLKKSSSTYQFYTGSISEFLDIYIDASTVYYNDVDGYGNTYYLYDYSDTEFLAVNAALTFDVETPSSTTGWYLPAIGNYYDFVENIAEVDMSDYKSLTYTSSSSSNTFAKVSGAGISARTAINAALSKVGSGNYDQWTTTSTTYIYWGSSIFQSINYSFTACFLNVNATSSDMIYISPAGTATNTYYVRPILAF